MLARWVEAGLTPDSFWENTPAQFMVVVDAAERRLVREIEQQRRIIYAKAVLTSYAYHSPNKMPDFDEFFGHRPKRQTGEEIKRTLDRFASLQSATQNRKLAKT